MNFKLILVPETPDKALLYPETPLSGLAFIEEASACLRRNLDNQSRCRHQTLGTITQYEISVPQAIAIESERYKTTDTFYLVCESDVLKRFIFYGASMTKMRGGRCYPYYSDEVVLTSYIDELAIIDLWRERGYPDKIQLVFPAGNIPLVPDESCIPEADIGDLIFDDLLR